MFKNIYKVFLILLTAIVFSLTFVKQNLATYTGTAFFINANGYMLTAAHVVSESKVFYVVVKNQLVKARLISIDTSKDLAILKVDIRTAYIPLNFKTGDMAAAVIGYPLPSENHYRMTVGQGEATVRAYSSDIRVHLLACQGDSGAPIIDAYGQVIGMERWGYGLGPCSTTGGGTSARGLANFLIANNIDFKVTNNQQRIPFSVDYENFNNNDAIVLIYAW